jgi:photosystem II stability/assembly factor-like uncharacterized protein
MRWIGFILGNIMRLHVRVRRFLLAFLSLLLVALPASRADEEAESKGGPPELKRLKFRSIGPSAGGRVCRAAGVPGDPLTYYAATAGGGVWKTADGGLHWKSIFDDQPISSIGSLAIAPSDPNVIYVGSGEANIRGNVQPGNGIYKSTDAGKTWKHVWKQEGQIGTMVVHPTNPDIAYAAVLGHAFGPNPQRGVYRTTDGGKIWQRVLYKDVDTGASDVVLDPNNPRILFAGLWQARRLPWDLTSGGPGSGLYTSRDGGDTWTQLVPAPDAKSADTTKEAPSGQKRCPGLPDGTWGKIGLAVAPSDSRRIYALLEADKGGLLRSNDGGDTWEVVNSSRALRQRAWYYTTLCVDPKNADIVWFPQVPLLKTIDGGKSLLKIKGPHHGDHHDIWIDPRDPRRIIDSNDGGVDISTNGGETWYGPPLPIAQFYHISVDTRTPYHVSGTMQDIGTASGPTNSLSQLGIPLAAWFPVGGGETGFTASDPNDPNIVYAGEYGGYISRYDHRTRQAKSIGVYPFDPSGYGAENLRYRFQWTAPLLISPHDSKVVYHGGNVLFKTRDAGLKWEPISGDLTRNDRGKQKWAGGPITGDNTGVEVYGTIFAIAESPLQKGLLWAGSDDGLVHVTHDGGKQWTNVTANLRGLPEWGSIYCIEASVFDAETAYVVVNAHKLDDMRPYLYMTTDGGKSWKNLSADLPLDIPLHVIREDPKHKGLLYLGTERGISFTTNGGETWKALKLNLPTVAVTDLVVKENDLVVGTMGRSIWILDDLTPVRLLSREITEKDMTLLPPQLAVRWRYASSLGERATPGSGQNPPDGAILHYHLKSKAKGEITLDITDAKGNKIETLTSKEEPKEKEEEGDYGGEPPRKTLLPTDPGLHRVIWNLRHKAPELIKGARVDSGEPRIGPLVSPGTYTLKLTVGDKTETAKLEVVPDPRTVAAGLTPELEAQATLTLKIRDDISRLTRVVEQLRSLRRQLLSRNELLENDKAAEPLIKASKALLPKLDELEEKLHNPKAKVSYDILAQKGGAKLYSQLVWLFDLIKESDGAPTQGLREVYAEQNALLHQYESDWKTFLSSEVSRLNELAKKLDQPAVIVPATSKIAK